MRETWRELVGSVLHPARTDLVRCERERQPHLEALARRAEARARAIAGCVARIEAARSVVFAADDGVVTRRMTELEREWRRLSRPDPDAGLMDLWARIAPPAWLDRKRWRDSPPDARLDAAIALASDPAGVEAAEAAALRLTGLRRVRWCPLGDDVACMAPLLEAPLAAARDRASSIVVARAEALEREVLEVATAHMPDRPLLARDVAHAAFADHVCRRASPGADPIAPLRGLLRTGYVIASLDADAVTLAFPPL